MKIFNYFFLLSICLLMSCCSDDDANQVIPDENLSAFLEDSTPRFSGILNGTEVLFVSGPGYQYGSSFVSDPNDESVRVLQFQVLQNNTDNYFSLNSPAFDTALDNQFNTIFGLGRKDLGYYFDDFNLNFKIGDDLYQICGPQVGNEMEILQMTEVTNTSGENILRVWLKLTDLRLIDYCSTNNDYTLENGLIVADFFGFRSE